MKVEGYTATQIAEILNISYDNVRQRISKAKIRPITKEAIYPLDTPDRIKDVNPVGRPKRPMNKIETAQISLLKALLGMDDDPEKYDEKHDLYLKAMIEAIKDGTPIPRMGYINPDILDENSEYKDEYLELAIKLNAKYPAKPKSKPTTIEELEKLCKENTKKPDPTTKGKKPGKNAEK